MTVTCPRTMVYVFRQFGQALLKSKPQYDWRQWSFWVLVPKLWVHAAPKVAGLSMNGSYFRLKSLLAVLWSVRKYWDVWHLRRPR